MQPEIIGKKKTILQFLCFEGCKSLQIGKKVQMLRKNTKKKIAKFGLKHYNW